MSGCMTAKVLHLTIKKDLFKVFLSGLPNVAVMEGEFKTPIDFTQQLLNSLDHYNFLEGSVMFSLLCNSAQLASFTDAL